MNQYDVLWCDVTWRDVLWCLVLPCEDGLPTSSPHWTFPPALSHSLCANSIHPVQAEVVKRKRKNNHILLLHYPCQHQYQLFYSSFLPFHSAERAASWMASICYKSQMVRLRSLPSSAPSPPSPPMTTLCYVMVLYFTMCCVISY